MYLIVREYTIGWICSDTEISFEKMWLLNLGGSTIHIGDPTPRTMLITMVEVDTIEDQDQSKEKWHRPSNN